MRSIAIVSATVLAFPAFSDTVVSARTIRPNQIIMETDVVLAAGNLSSGFSRLFDVVGQEARVALYAGRPILVGDIGPPAVISRNQIIDLRYNANGITITTEGRALERGAIGDRIRVMNLGSRATIFGQILGDGTIEVRN
ncbi:flagellar basal body P-ring formation chaperone FlgA [Sulfitobacter donghicola]|uniref:Flagella basal body P-ring formation protein FlgA n=1 Tax=Sulfitobacter donghicola DSW-25 = KCTC 12864 = JCM 14565 TaxID=1300350 RepID=A0A073ILX4_9RHOB|nr:flagellar basal body P-ring formation chaperone FlgA [Sulfitobacter donghicola]KEJ90550.1 flagellar basal body P-ring biosynthesis protein FlgA [Sulfitobacter donghicola DSW-25 = KCTC 12864 = JCM 14565]KIN67795.1 Flagellar basal body P-ring formation protein FlgA [Sulfitobacter donghicola DSW-25 = KCTC 12864 = JCM 14565]